ncbi:unnamed protein product [Musa acuminata subsp. malaccensis]|uniref:(wild Malaysian banana) hypothetical protein n=1 Tax=Musa acuminata subsp. malaccensis TaxID=214687 RepID=A0A804ISB9_MUSAM|nr:unnamed protein product [Musa acuminata subsp. malaccensis]
MGLCFSKKKASSRNSHASKAIPNEKKAEKPSGAAVESAAVQKQAVVIIQNARKSASKSAAAEEKVKDKKAETPTNKVDRKVETCGADPVLVVPVVEEFRPTTVVGSSSCTKEELDAILIQCGRLSRSSSGNASNGNGGGHRKYSGSKRSYDFDSEKKAEEEEEECGEKPVSRPSPHRRTPGRERSGSRERGGGGGGGRRVSRSPGRRTEVPASPVATSERSRQPAKMVAVPARDKRRGVSPAAPNKRGRETGAVRSASPQPRSPASTTRISNENASYRAPPPNQPQSLSRSSSRKAEQSPYRRSPMKEVNENILNRTNQNKSSENGAQVSKGFQKNGAAKAVTNAVKSSNPVTDCVREQLMGCRGRDAPAAEEETEKASAKVEVQNPRTITRTRSSRRSSRDLDHALGLNQEALLNPNPYASLLLEDIQNQHPDAAFSVPACVSKAFSIVEAVADLNSGSSENRSYAGDRFSHNNGSLDGRHGRRGLATEQPFVETEIVAKDDLLEPSLHRYVTMTDLGVGDVEPQESAGSNSVVGQPWASPWEPTNSVDSTDQCWTSRSNNGDEVEQEARLSSSSYGGLYQWQQQPQESETRVRRPWAGSSENKRDCYRRTPLHPAGAGAKTGSRSCSLPVSAAAAATT